MVCIASKSRTFTVNIVHFSNYYRVTPCQVIIFSTRQHPGIAVAIAIACLDISTPRLMH